MNYNSIQLLNKVFNNSDIETTLRYIGAYESIQFLKNVFNHKDVETTLRYIGAYEANNNKEA